MSYPTLRPPCDLLYRCMICLGLAAAVLLFHPAPSLAGNWKIAVSYAGSGSTSLSGAGTNPSSYNQVNSVNEPYSSYNLSTINNSPTFTQTGGITGQINGYIAEGVLGSNQSVDMEMTGASMTMTLTWQPGYTGEPAPATVPVAYRRHITVRAEADGCGQGASETATATGTIDGLSANPSADAAVTGPSSATVVSGPYTSIEPGFTREALPVTNGVASKSFTCGWSVKMNLTTLFNVNGMNAQTTLDVDFAVQGYNLSKFPGTAAPVVAGANASRSSDPTFTRWLPLSFSPSVNNQPFRHQAGALPGPWGNLNCFYSLAVQSETNLDIPWGMVNYLPGPGSDGTYNAPSPPYTALPGSFVPAYSITDTGGDRLLFDSSLNPYTDVHSTLVKMPDTTYQLQNAGPPGSMKARGYYTYSFQALSGGIGRLTAIADNLGNTQTLTWGSSPYLTVTDSSSGRRLLFYTTSGYLSSVDAPGLGGATNTHTTVSFDSGGHMTAVNVYAGGSGAALHTDTWAYGGPNGDSITSRSQGVSQATFTDIADSLLVDPFNLSAARLSSASYGSSTDNSSSDDGQSILGVWNYTYAPVSQGYNHWGAQIQTNSVQDARGNTTSVQMGLTGDSTGKVKSLRVTGPDFSGAPTGSNIDTVSFSPDITNPTSMTETDPLGHNWSSALNSLGETTSLSDPLNHNWSYNYSTTDARLLTSMVDPTSLTWHFNYGENGNAANELTSIADPASVTQVQLNYNTFGQPINETVPATTSASGVAETTSFSYDATTGDLTDVTDPLSDQATIDSYDPLGDPLSATVYPDTGNPANSAYPLRTTLTWDAGQELTQAVFPDSVQVANTWNNGVFTGTQAKAPAGAGGAVLAQQNFTRDTRGRLYQASDLVGTTGQWRFDKNSNPTKILDGVGNTTVVSYGKDNEVTGVTWPDGTNHSNLSYDAAGRTSSATDERGVAQNFLHDNADRLTDVQFPAYSTQNVHFTYDNANRPLSATDATGGSTFNYDATLKRLSSVQTTLGGMAFTVAYTYFPDGKRKTLTLTSGSTNYTWTYAYNAGGELTSLLSPFGETTGWTYDHAGRITGQTTTTAANAQLANLYTYGVSGQTGDPSTAPVYLRTIQQKINGSLFWTYTLQHSYLSQLLSQTGSGSDGTTESESYGFDLRGRLASDSEQYNGGGHNYTNSGSFGYDLANNLNGQTGGWTYNSDDQVTVANSGLGGLPAATGLAYDAAGDLTGLNGMTLSYDPWGRVSSISGTPYGTVSFTYDFAGRRVSKTVSGATTYYLYDGDLLLAEVNSTGQVQTIYTWGAQGLISDRIHLQTTPQSRFYEFDATGSTRALLDQNGVGLSRGTYSAWGSSTGYTPGTPLAWNGRAGIYTDAETGLMLMGARYYSPSIGRFISRDPAGFSAGINLYAYCGGDPINYFDPLGLDFSVSLVPGSPIFVFSAEDTEQGLNAGADAVTYVFTLGKHQPSEQSWNTPGFGAAVGAARVGQIALAGATAGAFTAPAALAAGATMPALAAANPQVVAEASQEGETLCAQAAEAIAPRTLFHYTSEDGLTGILDSGELKASVKVVSPNDARYGDGQYLSDIIPGTKTPAQLSRTFIGQPFQGAKYTHFVGIDVTGLQVIKGRPGVFVIPNDSPLDLAGRIVSSGAH